MLSAALSTLAAPTASAQEFRSPAVRLDEGRFTVVAESRDQRLARSLLSAAQANDTFPGLPRPRDHVLIAIAPDAQRFRAWVGPNTPEWGAAIAIPDERRVVMQGSAAPSDAGDPLVVLRHELAHLALHETMGRLPSRWFDEGYASFAAGEWTREVALETSLGLVWHTLPSRDSLESGFSYGTSRAQFSYAVSQRVVAELAALDPANGLRNFFAYWKETGSFEIAVRRAYGLTSAQFDQYWQQRTLRQFGVLSVAANLSLISAVFGLLLGPLFYLRRRRYKKRLNAMREADAAQDRERAASALEALLAEPAISDSPM